MSRSLRFPVLKKYDYNNIFIETGTELGGGVEIARKCSFKFIHSIEIFEPYYNACMRKFSHDPRVILHLGDSTELLENIIKDIYEPITFFLDGHVDKNNNMVGKEEVPIFTELEIIKNHPIKNHVIMIDDRRCMGKIINTAKQWKKVWTDILQENVEKVLLDINSNYEIIYEDSVNANKDIIVARICND